AIDHVLGELGHVPQRVVVRLLHHEPEVLVRVDLGELGDAPADHINRSHGRSPLTNFTTSSVAVPGRNSARTPAAFRRGMSSSGMIPPPKSTVSSAPCSLSSSNTRGNR